MRAMHKGQARALPRCSAPLSTVATVEDQYASYQRYNVRSPLPVLRLLVAQSGCFNIVDRGAGLTRIRQEDSPAEPARASRNSSARNIA
ncbi:MAG: hypothetical protein R3C97_19160 [Geminicoccaceae bacterium]